MKQIKNHIGSLIEKNSVVNEGNGKIRVKGGLTLTDFSTRQHNGTQYDKSTSVEDYDGRLFADHGDAMAGYTIDKIIGRLIGVKKTANRIVAEGIQYFMDNPLGLLAYNGTAQGFLTDFSIGTMGGAPDDEGVYREHSVFEVSQVGIGNHPKARLNQLITNSISEAKENGLDTTVLEDLLATNSNDNKEKDKQMLVTIKNTREFPVKLSYKNASGEDTETTVQPGEGVDVDEGQKDGAQAQIKNAVAPKEDKPEDKKDIEAIVNEAVAAATKPLQEQIKEVEQNKFDQGAQEPEFVVNGSQQPNMRHKNAKANIKGLDWESRTVHQIENARRVLVSKGADQDAARALTIINESHLDMLKEKNLVKNDMTIGDFGNFVISPEQLSEIQGFRSDYSALVDLFGFRETLSTVTQWLKRSGDIDMTHVDYDPSAITDSGYLKPVSDYTATLETMELEELAAVTPVANAATQFLAADILADVNQGYRTDYQRKLAQLIVARLEQAVDGNGNSSTYGTTSDVNAIKAFIGPISELAEEVGNGVLIMNYKTYWQLVSRAAGAGISGPLAGLVTSGDQPQLFGKRVVVVPNDLLPSLNTAETKTFVIEESNVTVNHAIFYVNPTNWVGRVSGGLRYDLSTDAAYEVSGTVRSAFQRNQMVLRGSFFRGGNVANEDLVSGLLSPGVS